MYTKLSHKASYIQDVNSFIEFTKRYTLIKHTKDIYYFYCDCQNHIIQEDSNTIRSHLVRSGFVENYTTWDQHGERCTKASNQEGITQVREPNKTHEDFYNNANPVMMHDGKGDDGA